MTALHITIGSTPHVNLVGDNSKIFLENDLRMVKAALLYADKVTLCSLASSSLIEIAKIGDFTDEKRLEFFYTMMELFPEDDTIKLFKVLVEMVESTGQKIAPILKSAFEGNGWDDIRNRVNEFIKDAGGEGILKAIQVGILDVHTFDDGVRRLMQNSEIRNLALEYINIVSTSVNNTNTYPLFDEDTNEIINAGINAGIFPVSDFAISRGKETGLAADLLERLPVFPNATISQILEVRNELAPQLTRFRSAMIKFSDDIKHVSWDKSFSFDAETVFRRDIQPTILDIEDEVKANRFVADLVRKLADKSFLWPSSAGTVSGIALEVSNLPLYAIASFSAGVLLGGAAAAYDTYKEWSRKNREIQQNNMFFMYKANRLLSRNNHSR